MLLLKSNKIYLSPSTAGGEAIIDLTTNSLSPITSPDIKLLGPNS